MQMQNRMAVLLCNLRPAQMGGVVSQAMVVCACSPDKVELLDPPSGAAPGDRVTFQGFPGTTTLYIQKNTSPRHPLKSCPQKAGFLQLHQTPLE